jgi:hypothetical protein
MIIKLPNPLYAVTFDKTAKTVTIANLGNVDSAIINRIVNKTDDIEIFGSALSRGGTIVKSLTPDQIVITLDYDTTAMDDADVIEVSVDVSPDEILYDVMSHQSGGGGGGGGAITSVDLGEKADAAAGSDTATASVIAFLKRAQQRWTALLSLLTAGLTVYGKMRGPVSDSFTRPADASPYAIGDAIQNATSSPATRRFLNLFPSGGGSGYISIAAVVRNAAITARLRIHLFATDPATKAVDNAAFSVATGDEGAYLGYIDLDAMVRGVACSSNRKEVVVAGTDVFYQIETLDGFTPASGTNYLFKATLDANV